MDLSVLEDVLHVKKAFYNSSYSNYDYCLNGNFKIIPDINLLEELRHDYENMNNSGMLYNNPPSFDEMASNLQVFERNLNVAILNKL